MSVTQEIREGLENLIMQARRGVRETEDAREEALLETTAEVLGGLARAYQHRDAKSEDAWRDDNTNASDVRSGEPEHYQAPPTSAHREHD